MDSGKVRSIRQEKEGVGEGERRGEGMDICGGEWGEGRTGEIPAIESGREGGGVSEGWGGSTPTIAQASSPGAEPPGWRPLETGADRTAVGRTAPAGTRRRDWRTCGGGAGCSGWRSWRPTTCLARFLLWRPRRLLNLGSSCPIWSLKAADMAPCLAAGARGFLNSGSGSRGRARGEVERACGGAGSRICLDTPVPCRGRPARKNR